MSPFEPRDYSVPVRIGKTTEIIPVKAVSRIDAATKAEGQAKKKHRFARDIHAEIEKIEIAKEPNPNVTEVTTPKKDSSPPQLKLLP